MDPSSGKAKWQRLFRWVKSIPVINWIILFISIATSILLFFHYIWESNFDASATLANILTINAIFSAILTTYLFTQISWDRERIQNIREEAVSISRKITDFRRILFELTHYFNVWRNDKSTKHLLEHGKFSKITFFEFRRDLDGDSEGIEEPKLAEELLNHEDFNEGSSQLFLAMDTFIHNRKAERKFDYDLYNDYQFDQFYNIKFISDCRRTGLCSSIWYWLDKDYDDRFIQYSSLGTESKEKIKAAAGRIDAKYGEQDLGNRLIKNIASSMDEFYLPELYKRLDFLHYGPSSRTAQILTITLISFVFGVLCPFILQTISIDPIIQRLLVEILTALNIGLMVFFSGVFGKMLFRTLKSS